MGDLVIFGTGDVARLAHYYFMRGGEHRVAAFAVDAAYRATDEFLDLPLISFENIVHSYPPLRFKMFVGIGYSQMNKARARKYFEAKSLGYELVSYISPRCTWLTEHPVGDNCFILEDNTVQPFVRIGNNVTLWSGNHIGHDSIIEDHCFLASHIVVSGHVHIHSHCFIGVNATLRNSITIARETLIGAGAVIIKDTVEKGVYVPYRAERLEKTSDEIEL